MIAASRSGGRKAIRLIRLWLPGTALLLALVVTISLVAGDRKSVV